MPSWQDIASEAQKHRDDTIAIVDDSLTLSLPAAAHNVIAIPRQILSREEARITELPVSTLVQNLAAGTLTSVTVVKAFLRRAAIAQKLVNCIFELLPERAVARASELDEHLRRYKKPVGPLHGIPISSKAILSIKGLRNGGGFTSTYRQVGTDDAEILRILISAGAVHYARTTEPQAVMMTENSSYVTGITTNPHNTATTCGGSSGGEAALQALNGSPLGIGGDTGGSVRSPAGNCGTYALKPTTHRIPGGGIPFYMANSEAIVASGGPMSPTLDGIDLFMKVVLGSEPWKNDPSLHELPWRRTDHFTHDGKFQLTVGVMWDDNVVKPVKPVTRALREVVERLKAIEGVTIIEWKPYQHERGMKILEKLYSPDGGKVIRAQCEATGEPIHPLISYRMIDGPGVEDQDIHSLWKWTGEREAFRYEYLQKWKSYGQQMDVILCPYLPTPAPPLETTRYWGYTSIWNLLDYPAAVFPVGRVDPELDAEPQEDSYVPRNDQDAWCRRNYDARTQKDVPISLQLVGQRLQDEKVVQALEIIVKEAGLPVVDCLAEGRGA